VNRSKEIRIDSSVAPRKKSLSLPGAIIWVTCVHVAIGLAAGIAYLMSGEERWIRIYFDYQGSLFLVVVGGVEFFLTALARRQFHSDEPLRKAWSLIMLAAAVRWTGLMLANWLTVYSYINPRVYLAPTWDVQAAASLRELGLLVNGPIHMLLLAAGLSLVLRLYKRLRILVGLEAIDYLLLALVLAFTLSQGYQIFHVVSQSHDPVTLTAVLKWLTDPLLSCLLVEAVLIRRAVVNMGWGLISKSWGAYTAAIFLTSVADMGMWADDYGYIRWQVGALTWYLWFIVAAAYALAPAYQLQASIRAKQELRT